MTGNVAQVFLTDDEWEQTLRGIGAALRPGGHLAFETRRPEYGSGRSGRQTPPRSSWTSPGLTSDSTLRFRGHEEVESSLAACGYRVAEVRDAPDRPGREFVFIAEHLA
jgi:O-methyltransferase involved in polyketide biosynthesis